MNIYQSIYNYIDTCYGLVIDFLTPNGYNGYLSQNVVLEALMTLVVVCLPFIVFYLAIKVVCWLLNI